MAQDPIPVTVTPGALIAGRYQVCDLLGQGSGSAVWRVLDRAVGKEVALKLQDRRLEENAKLAFRREFLLASRLRHSALVGVIDFGTLADGRCFFTMPVARGRPLGALCPAPPDLARRALVEIARLLVDLHADGLVHGDLKSANVIWTEDQEVKVIDLGLAQARGERSSGGTPAYLAPEVILGAPSGCQSDLYALGAIGYELLSGSTPFPCLSVAEAIQQALSRTPAPLPAPTPTQLATLVMRLLNKDPAHRPTAAEVLDCLTPQWRQAALPKRLLSAPLVGRSQASVALEDLIRGRLAQGTIAVVRVGGAMGLGKDRLVAELRAKLQVSGVSFVSAFCQVAGAAYRVLDSALVALAPNRSWPWQAARRSASPESLLAQAMETLADLASQGSFILHLADWHLADEASVALVDHVERVAVPGSGVLLLTDRKTIGCQLELGPLDLSASEALARALLQGAQLAPELGGELLRRAGGNPLFLQSMIGRLLDYGQLEQRNGCWVFRDQMGSLSLPSGLNSALFARFEDRSPGARQVCKALAVVGHPAALHELASTSGLEPDPFVQALGELEVAGMVQVESPAEPPCVLSASFAQGAMAEAIVDRLAVDERRSLCQRWVDLLLPRAKDDATRSFDLARLGLLCCPPEVACRFALNAAKLSLEVYATGRARALLQAGLAAIGSAAGTLAIRSEFLELLADVDRHQGDMAAAQEKYEQVVAELEPRSLRLPVLLNSLGLALLGQNRYAEAFAICQRADTAARELGDRQQELRAKLGMARVVYLEGDDARALELAGLAIAAADRPDLEWAKTEALGLKGHLLTLQDPKESAQGLQLLEQSLRWREQAGDPVAVNDALMLLGNAQAAIGRPLEALKTFEEQLAICHRSGAAAEDAVTARLNVALAQCDLGAYTKAAATSCQALCEAQSRGFSDLEAYALVTQSVALAHLGRIPEAQAGLRQARVVADSLDSPYLLAAVKVFGAEAQLVMGHALEARDDLEEARRLVAQAQTREFDVRLLCHLVQAYLQMGCVNQAEALVNELESKACAYPRGLNQQRAWFAQAHVCWAIGDLPASGRLYETALDLATQMGAAFAAGASALGRGWVHEAKGRMELAKEDFLTAQRFATAAAEPHLLVDALSSLARVATEETEAERLVLMARGHLDSIVAALDPACRRRYLALGPRGKLLDLKASSGRPGVGPNLETFLDRPLRDFVEALAPRQTTAASLNVGELVAQLLDQQPDPDEVLRRTLESARQRFDSERCLALVHTPSGLSVKAVVPAQAGSEEFLTFSRTFIELAMSQDRTLWTIDAHVDPRLSASASISALQLRAIACTPLRISGKPAGALYLDWGQPDAGLVEGQLADFEALANIAAVCLTHAEFMKERKERERMRQELELARQVQQGLSSRFLPQVPGAKLAVASQPALEVGGDFFDTLALLDGRIGLLVGDVAGKGVPAALVASALLALFRVIAPQEPSPAKVLEVLNTQLFAHRPNPKVWASALYAIYDPRSRSLAYACAGHPPPLSVPEPLACEGPALGVVQPGEYSDQLAILRHGSAFALYTDGLEELKPSGTRDTIGWLIGEFGQLAPQGARAIVDGLLALARASHGDRAFDDVTVVALTIDG